MRARSSSSAGAAGDNPDQQRASWEIQQHEWSADLECIMSQYRQYAPRFAIDAMSCCCTALHSSC
jgi:hypothetical protein